MAWSAGSTSKPSTGEPTVRFTSIGSLAGVPSRRNRELPALIAKEHPDRLTGLAALGGRRQVESVTDAEVHVAPRIPHSQGRLEVSLAALSRLPA